MDALARAALDRTNHLQVELLIRRDGLRTALDVARLLGVLELRLVVVEPALRSERLGLNTKPRLVEGEVFELFESSLDLFSDRVVF